jgi:hypothetical protein
LANAKRTAKLAESGGELLLKNREIKKPPEGGSLSSENAD